MIEGRDPGPSVYETLLSGDYVSLGSIPVLGSLSPMSLVALGSQERKDTGGMDAHEHMGRH